MRIGIEAQRIFRKKKHGMDIVALELIKALQRSNTQHEFVVFVKPDEDEQCLQASANVKIVKVRSAPYPIWEQLYLPKAAAKEKVDVLHCTSNTAPLWLKVPLCLTLHDIIYLEKISLSQGTSYQKFGNIYRKLNVPKIVPKAVKILTVSDFEKDRIQQYFNLNNQRVLTAYNGVGAYFQPVLDQTDLNKAKAKYQLPDQFIFFLGNTDPKKNVKGVLQALSILKKQNALPAPLVMLDINRDYLQTLATEIGDSEILNQIHFTGYVPNKELPAIYSLASLFLYPSLRESFGIPLVEAMACGVPVITSNTSSMPEVAQDAALIVDPFKPESIAVAIQQLWQDKALQQSLITKGIQRAKHFNWDANALLTLNVYEEVFQTSH
jgi:glycosyltransferase involved in cell wall biosynthesis